jgi:rhodanese-related sulfurtransferase
VKRRTFLAASGLAAASSVAGCSGSSGSGGESSGGSAPFEHPGTLDGTFATNGEFPPDDDPADGRPPAFPDPPAAPDVDESSFETLSVNGESVKLAPIDIVGAWYRRAEARFVDARGLSQYERSHVYGGVLSTAQKNSAGGGIEGWSTDDRVVTYCGCPHHLSSIRAAGLQKAGFSRVYAIDEGFGAWSDRSYPMSGTAFATGTASAVSTWVVRGRLDDRHAGEYVWASAARQYEAAPVRDDGRFTLRLAFADVTEATPVRVSAPGFSTTRPLGELASAGIEG